MLLNTNGDVANDRIDGHDDGPACSILGVAGTGGGCDLGWPGWVSQRITTIIVGCSWRFGPRLVGWDSNFDSAEGYSITSSAMASRSGGASRSSRAARPRAV